MASKKKNIVRSVRQNQRSYLNKDFSGFRSELQQYGQTYFSDKISDFSENGVAGMFIEMAAYVGDVMSYYLDHQFNELDILTAVETDNIERLVRNSGVKIRSAAPSSTDISVYIEVPAAFVNNEYAPNHYLLPIIKSGTIFASTSGISFELLEDLNFSKRDSQGSLKAPYATMKSDSSGNPTTFSVKMIGRCTSGITSVEGFNIPDTFSPFRTLTLKNPDVSEIISVKDSDGKEYYEVSALTQDTVYKRVSNTLSDSDLVSENIELIPAPRRFVVTTSRASGLTTLRFGGGDALSTDDDIMPDPSEISLPLYGDRKTFSRFALDPNKLLKTRTLGIAPRNTTISVRYRSGGGLSHNVSSNSIVAVSNLLTKFSSNTKASQQASIRASVEVINENPAAGGEAAPTINELKASALAYKNSQSRIVTKSDLVARIYSMPSNFGRVFRVGVRDNPNNPLASVLSIISRDTTGKLVVSPDSLKENLRLYLNEFRLISDAIDIVDTKVLNVKVTYGVVSDSASNSNLVLQKVNKSISAYLKIDNFQIDQPIISSDLVNIIINTPGVVSLVDFKIENLTGNVDGRLYSTETFSVASHTDRGIIVPPPGSIFELKYPNDDIIGVAR
tara:strand:+ start:505 stop:2358 length:1854 start_codon:yes stop_codon:yes gene_type:complete